jgi:hypothetical protein
MPLRKVICREAMHNVLQHNRLLVGNKNATMGYRNSDTNKYVSTPVRGGYNQYLQHSFP